MAGHETALDQLKLDFMSALSKMDRPHCIRLWTDILATDTYNIPDLYEQILVPSLNDIATHEHCQTIPVWEEHLRSGIVKTALELTAPYVLGAREKLLTAENNRPLPKALVLCLEEEYHEIGARMVSDYLLLLGFDVYFIGANTPNKEIMEAVHDLAPHLVTISITNYYHIFKLQALMDAIKKVSRRSPTIVLGGYAIDHTPEVHQLVSPDYFATVYSDFVKIKEGLTWD